LNRKSGIYYREVVLMYVLPTVQMHFDNPVTFLIGQKYPSQSKIATSDYSNFMANVNQKKVDANNKKILQNHLYTLLIVNLLYILIRIVYFW
jgi:hypothetical protein